MAVQTNTAVKVARGSVRPPKGFRPAPETKVSPAATTRLAYRWKKNPGEASGHTLLMGDDGEYRFQVQRNVGPAAGGVHGDYLYIDQPKHLVCEGPVFTQAPNRAELVESLEALIANGRAEWARETAASPAVTPAEHAADADLGLVAALLNGDRRVTQLYNIITTKDPEHVEAWLRMGEAVAAGEDFAAAEARFKEDVAGLDPDAELIRACLEIDAARAAYNTSTDVNLPLDQDPLWLAYERQRDIIGEAKATSIAGLVAKARAAVTEATEKIHGVITVDPENTPAAGWSWDIVKDLLRLVGDTPKPVAPACPAAALIPDIIAAMRDDDLMNDHVIGRDTLLDEVAKHHDARAMARLDALWTLVETVRPTSASGAQICLLAAIRHVDDLEGNDYSEAETLRKAEAARHLMAGAYYVLDKLHGSAGLDRVRETYIRISRYSLATDEEFGADRRVIHDMCGRMSAAARAGT